MNDSLRPSPFISMATGTTAMAVPMTMHAMGSVESLLIGASCAPISPPANTTNDETDIIRH